MCLFPLYQPHGLGQVYQFLQAAVTNCPRLDGLKLCKSIIYSSGSQKPKRVSVQGVSRIPKVLGDDLLLCFVQLLDDNTAPWFVAPSFICSASIGGYSPAHHATLTLPP